MTSTVDTIVVGGGIAGLTYAHALGEAADVVVLEAGVRPGGLIRTHRHGKHHVECGPEALLDNSPPTRELIAELGLQVVEADPAARKRYILDRKGRLIAVPTGPVAFLTSPLLGPLAKLRLFTEPFRSRDVGLDGSIADFVRHRLGPQALERLVDPALSGIYAGDPEKLSLRASFPLGHELVSEHGSLFKGMMARCKARARERKAAAAAGGQPAERRSPTLIGVEGGMQRLPEALGAALGGRLRTSTPVARVRREGTRWVAEGPEGRWEARRLVLAVPAANVAELLATDEPALSQQAGSMVSEAVVSVAHAWQRQSVAHPLDAFGYLVPSSLGLNHLGTLFSSSIQPGRWEPGQVVLRTLMGGARHPELVERDDASLLGLIRREVGEVLGIRDGAEPAHLHVSRWTTALPRYDLDQVERQDAIDGLLAQRSGLHILGNHRRGI